MTAQPSSPVDEPATPERVAAPPSRVLTAASLTDGPAEPARRRSRFGAPPRGPLLTGLAASLLMMVGGFGGGGILLRDPILTNSPLGFWRYGHGHELATALIYLGVVLMAWAWIRLGREVLAERVGGRAVLTTAGVWLIPMLVTPPLFTRDVFSYLAQGALPLAGFDPYAVGPEAMPGVFTANVHYFWQDTPAPYGPLFILLAKTVAWTVGTNIIAGVLLMRLTLVLGLLLLVWALPELTRRLGGRRAGGAVGRRRQPDDGHPHGRGRAQRPARHGPAGHRLAVRPARPARRRHHAGDGGDGGEGQRRRRAAVPGAGLGRAHERVPEGPDRQGHGGRHRGLRRRVHPDHPRRPGGPGLAPRAERPVADRELDVAAHGRRRVRALAPRDPLRPAQAAVHQRRADHRRHRAAR